MPTVRTGLGLTAEEVYGLIEDRVLEINEKLCSIDKIRDENSWISIKTESLGRLMRIMYVNWKNKPVRRSQVERKLEGIMNELHGMRSEIRSLKREFQKKVQAGSLEK